MKKLLDGLRDFRDRVRPAYLERFGHLAHGQSPDCLFVACSDSRVVPNVFASTDPGDLFVVRNVGNIVPPCGGSEDGDNAPGAAIEFAVASLGVRDIVVCGHSGCGAMQAALTGHRAAGTPHLDRWLRHAAPSLARLGDGDGLSSLAAADRLSQLHAVQQLEHLRSYPIVSARLAEGRLRMHAWWFDLANAEVFGYDAVTGVFRPLV